MLSVIIPCFNESKKVFTTLDSIAKWLQENEIEYEILLVNNGSTDDTFIKFNKSVKNPKISIIVESIKGKGFAVKRGLEECSFNQVLMIDADMSVDISQIENSWFSQDESLIIGSRKIGIQQGTPVQRQFAGNFLNSLIRKIFKLNIYDTQCGFKFLNSEKVKIISSQLTVDGFMYDLDLIMSCIQNKISVSEVPISYRHDSSSSVSLLRDPIVMLRDLFKIYTKFN